MNNMMQERNLQQSDEMRGGSNFGKGQMVAADDTMSPSIRPIRRRIPAVAS